ncbi:double-strand break repair enhancer MSC1 Ecym_8147 [Eremothecium cymbalariae DBVPG|uniref:Meiotic sister chromatid recombination protein 1 n=1 Tax=Eremothecium cymbalariae (strain CBS 270.75 / DBVPG 7215 / KCTC 17166 / NRRL Y-17582) TaxID=931890 RepID=G8JX61_ERECY|nr:Hypothetical protein Ecym_8147 [Eremothecium cymbalariae DBVPG\
MKFSGCVLVAAAAIAVGAESSTSFFDKWSDSDIKQYLKDNGHEVADKVQQPLESLKELALKEWQKHNEQKPWWKIWDNQEDSGSWLQEESDSEVGDWLFDTWSADSLKKLLKSARLKYDSSSSRDALVSTAKNNFKKISDKVGASGFYPSEPFFKHWETSDLKNWLAEYGISYDQAKSTRDDLLKKVRDNIHRATKYYDDERLELLTSLNFLSDYYDNDGSLDAVDFSSWSPSVLKKWLNLHKVKLDETLAEDRDYLINLATKSKNLLNDDVEWLSNAAQKQVSSSLSNGPDAILSLWDSAVGKGDKPKYDSGDEEEEEVINDTFLLDVEYWPKQKLKEFLEARDISYPVLSTRKDLRNMVIKYRSKPVKNLKDVDSAWFPGFSLGQNLQQWSVENTQAAKDALGSARDKLRDWTSGSYEKAEDSAESAGAEVKSNSKNVANNFKQKMSDWTDIFESWTADELTKYLNNFGIRVPTSFTKKKLVRMAKANSKSFFGPRLEPSYFDRLNKKVREWANYGYSYILQTVS